jgi:hypothetical protein
LLPRFGEPKATDLQLAERFQVCWLPPAQHTPAEGSSASRGLIVIGGNAGLQADPEYVRQSPCLAKNVIGFLLSRSLFCGHFRVLLAMARKNRFSAMPAHDTSGQF